jgi:Fe-S cluster assembly protein SufD
MTDRLSVESARAAFAVREARAAGPGWLREQRRGAMAELAARGLPTPRDEDWKYTSLAPLLAAPLDWAANGAGGEVSEDAVTPFLVGPASWPRLVFVNGRYVAKLSHVPRLTGDARVGSLAEALITDEETVRTHLVSSVRDGWHPFAALNAAFWEDGAFVHVPAGVSLPDPIHLIFVATGAPEGRADHPRSLVALGRGSRATVVESYVALGGAAYLANAVTRLALGPGAALDHVKVLNEGARAFHMGRMETSQERDSCLASCVLTFGGRFARLEIDARLGGEGTECLLSGLAVQGGRQHVDTHTVVDHERPHAMSRQLFKGVLDGKARGVFSGRVVVRPGANGTDAHQTNKNLLLSEGVEVDSKPQLEIFADDVKCSHGAADGQLADEALFYLKSRGLDEPAARTLLTLGFAREVLDRIRFEPIRDWCERLLASRLRDGRVMEETA